MIEEALHALRPGARWSVNGNTLAGIDWVDEVQARPTDAEISAKIEEIRVNTLRRQMIEGVVAERERRLALGFDYNFGDARGVHRIGTTEKDLKGWDEVSKYAGALIDKGELSTQINIATDTGPCTVTPIEWRAIEIASAQYRQPLWAKSFALMASNPIPADYTHDSYWS